MRATPPATHLADRSVIRLWPPENGEDVASFLQGLVTNDVTGPLPVYAGLLTAQGKALFDFIVWPGENDSLLLDCEADAAEALARRLSLYRLRRKIGIAIEPGISVHWEGRPGDRGAADPRLAALGQRWLAPAGDGEGTADAAWLAHRLRLGVAEGQTELGDILWLETNAAELNGVSFSKGCYVGQENTARMNWRQKVNRRLFVTLGGAERFQVEYPEIGLSVVHARVDAIPGNAILPDWLKASLAQPSTA